MTQPAHSSQHNDIEQRQAAVLGSPIEHSLSPLLHNAGYEALGLADFSYTRFECTAEQLPSLVSSLPDSFVGFSVTMPAKFAALEFADSLSDRAAAIGSANTLVRQADGTWWADNTDVDGVVGALAALDVVLQGATVAVFGAGGTARPVLWALITAGVGRIIVVNRSDRSAQLREVVDRAQAVSGTSCAVEFVGLDASADAVAQAALVVNTVPYTAERSIPTMHAAVFDVIYDPWPTPLVEAAQQAGHPTVGGHVMLAHQAYTQFEYFTGQAAPRAEMWKALTDHIGLQ